MFSGKWCSKIELFVLVVTVVWSEFDTEHSETDADEVELVEPASDSESICDRLIIEGSFSICFIFLAAEITVDDEDNNGNFSSKSLLVSDSIQSAE